ncbi:MAG: FAD-dependent monooxygenase [Actinobacteria bacterium]|nr:FAD-dependent monooxygenase [Actinomycetota bacterium]
MSEPTRTDVCVVGGGPAGLTLALLLLRSGFTVTVLERSRSFDREFRGEILQPGGMRLLDELGVLRSARAAGGYELTRFQLIQNGRVDMDIDYSQLEPPFDFLLSIPQRHLLMALLAECQQYENFVYEEGGSLTALLRSGERVSGVAYRKDSTEHQLDARCVVGADGRYSKTRKLAGIGFTRQEAFAHDVLWFRVPRPADQPPYVRVYRAEGNPVLAYDSYPDALQLGWTLPHRGYREVSAEGIGYVREQIMRAAPPFADAVRSAVQDLRDLTLLDVFAGYADIWAIDGLVLIGDSAHTHGPMGAQGINLAIQDAVLLHPSLVAALQANHEGVGVLSSYERRRRPEIDAISALQARQSRALLARSAVGDRVRPFVMRALAHTPVYGKILRRIAYGPSRTVLRSDLFHAGLPHSPVAPTTRKAIQ